MLVSVGENPYCELESGRAGRIGCKVHYLLETSSTQAAAAELAAAGAPSGTAVVAETQSAGRGRLGRSWYSPAGVNLYTTIIIRPRLDAARAPLLGLLAGVAVADTLAPLAPGLVALKWPNDIWLNHRKAGGILAQAVGGIDSPLTVLMGIGLNLNLTNDQMAPELRERATSLLIATGATCDRTQVAGALFDHLDRLLRESQVRGFEGVLAAWQRYSALTGRQVRINDGNEGTVGRVVGIDPDGALLLDKGSGKLARIVAGDVTIEGVYA